MKSIGLQRFPWLRSSGVQGYRTEIDGLRAIAVLAVIIHHFNQALLPGGYLGVDIFFVISGYVITASLARRSSEKSSDLLIDFYTRRVKRLVPALVMCVGLTALMISWFDPDPTVSLRTGMAALFGISNLYLLRQSADYYGKSMELNGFTQTWSLGVEEQFYLIFPLLVVLTGCSLRGSRSTRTLFWLVLGTTAASLLLFVVLDAVHPIAAFYLMPARFWELGAGCLLFLGPQAFGWLGSRPLPAGWSSLVPVGALIAGAAALCAPRSWSVPATLLIVVSSLILIGSLRAGSLVHRWLTQPWLVSIGVLSYSLYLWHWSVLCLSRWSFGITWWSAPFQLLLMGLLAWLSYGLVECPLRQRPWAPLRRITISFGVGASLLTALGLHLLVTVHRSGEEAERSSGPASSSVAPMPAKPGRPTFLVVGNSHAQHLAPLFDDLHRRFGAGVILFGPGGNVYPPLRVTVPAYPFTRSMWERTDQEMSAVLARSLPRLRQGDVVVLASKLEGVVTEDFYEEFYRARGLRTHRWNEQWSSELSSSQALAGWLAEVGRFSDRLRRRGIRLILVAPLPVFHGASDLLPVQACERSLRKLLLGRLQSNCVQTFSADRAELLVRFAAIRTGILGLEQRKPGLLIYDPFPVICPPDRLQCTTLSQGQVLFRDSNHLTPAGALALGTDFVRFLRLHRLLH